MSKAVRGPPIVERRGSIVPPIPSRPHHAASQKRPPRAETGKTSAAQLMSKAVRGLPIVERRGSIVPGFPRAERPLAVYSYKTAFQRGLSSIKFASTELSTCKLSTIVLATEHIW